MLVITLYIYTIIINPCQENFPAILEENQLIDDCGGISFQLMNNHGWKATAGSLGVGVGIGIGVKLRMPKYEVSKLFDLRHSEFALGHS